jgi:methionyl-tRNA formyltransferase
MNLRVLFMGSPDFALPTLTGLAERFNLIDVVTQPDRPAGRGRKLQPPPVKVQALDLDLQVFQPSSLKSLEVVDHFRNMAPDIIVVAAFGQILREDILSLPPFGCVNVHASLLPRWRGAAPIQAAILHDDVTGVSIMKMDQGLDTGPLLSQRSLPIPKMITAGELSLQLAQIGADLLVETLPKYVSGEIQPQPQDNENATYAPKLSKDDGKLDFNQPATFLARQVGAYHPWPGTFQYFNGIRLKVFQTHPVMKMGAIAGNRYIIDEQPGWGTANGILVLDEVQVAGKARISGSEFLHGNRDWINEKEDEDK